MQFGRYLVVKHLGQGGMGTVYEGQLLPESLSNLSEDASPAEAAAPDFPQRTAIKVLNASIEGTDDVASGNGPGNLPGESSQAVQRFEQEITALRMLSHPNIVRIVGFGIENNHLYYCMELVEGRNLHAMLLSGRRFSWQQVLTMAKQLTSAISSAHVRGIIHRDIKPGNILMAVDDPEAPVVKLTDFGVARVFSGAPMTEAGNIIGTFQYMAPEQAKGQPVTVLADLYSLGAVLYALMSGKPPFYGKSAAEIIALQQIGQPAEIYYDGLNHPIPESLRNILSQLLQTDPKKRIPTATALLRKLEAIHPDADETLVMAPHQDVNATALEIPNASGSTPMASPQQASPQQGAPQQTLPQQTSRPNVFVDVNNKSSQIQVEKSRSGTRWFGWMISLLWIVMFVMFVAGLVYFLQPPDAEELYNRLSTVQEGSTDMETTGNRLESRYHDLDSFLKRFPADSRYKQVWHWREAVDVARMERKISSRLAGHGRWTPDNELERQYLYACQLSETSASQALERFNALDHFYVLPEYDPQMGKEEYNCRICLQSVKVRIKSLNEQIKNDTISQREAINRRLDDAQLMMHENPGEADEIIQSVLLLYGENHCFDPEIKRAGQLRSQL